MINKQNLWFVTLFSLILILGIYYVSMPKDTISKFTASLNNEENMQSVEVEESDVIIAMKVDEEEKMLSKMQDAQDVLLNVESTIEEKNEAYKQIQLLNSYKGKADEIEKVIKEKYNLSSCIKIDDNNNINVILSVKDQGKEYANNIIKTVQEMFSEQMYITVNFQG